MEKKIRCQLTVNLCLSQVNMSTDVCHLSATPAKFLHINE